MAFHSCQNLCVAIAVWAACSVGAVNVGISGQTEVLDRFNAMNASDVSRLFNNNAVNFTAVTVPDGLTSSGINAFVANLAAQSLDLVIGRFNEVLASACSYQGLPFYSLSEKLLDPIKTTAAYLQGSTTLLVNTVLEELMLASVNFTATVAQRNVIVMLTDDVGAKLNVLLDRNISIEFRISVVNVTNSSSVRQLLFSSNQLDSVDTSVYLIVSGTPGVASAILKEAVYLSMLRSTAYWIIMDLFLDKGEMTQFYSTGATIITFRLPNADINNQSQLNFSMATDAIQHYVASSAYNATNGTSISIMEKIFLTTIDGAVSRLHFSSVNRQSDKFATNLMSTDVNYPTELILYATWNESVSDSIVKSRSRASLQLPVLRLSGALVDPFVTKTPSGYSGFIINVLQLISAGLFTYDLNDLSKNTSADYLKAVQLGYADLAVNLVELSSALMNDSRITLSEIPLLTSGVASMGGTSSKEVDFLSPLYPLSWNVWFAIILAFLILSATLYLTDKISPNDYKRPQYSIAKAAFFVYSSFVMSKLKSSAVKPSSRIFILILWFASLMYCTTYGTNYFFLLVRTNPNLPFTSLGGLYNQSSVFYWMMVKDSPEYRLLATQNSSVYQKIIIATPPTFVPSVADAASIIRNSTLPGHPKPIFIGDELTLNYYAARDCYLKSAGKGELSRNLHMVFNRNLSAKLISDVNNRIQELSDKGQLEQIKNNYWSVVLCSASENLITYSELTDVTVDQVAGIFIVLAAAFILSFLVVALEHVAYMIGLQVQRARADPKLQFNKTYRAVVTGITPAGVYVKLHGEKEFLPNHMLSPDASKTMTASELQISYDTVIEITYLGNDPVDGYRIFHRRG